MLGAGAVSGEGITTEALLDEAEQVDEQAAEMFERAEAMRGNERQCLQREASALRKVARSVRNEANAIREMDQNALFVRAAAKQLTTAQFRKIWDRVEAGDA